MADDFVRRFYRCRQTCCQMLEDRGYTVPPHEKNETYPDFVVRFDQAQRQRSRMIMLGSQRENENKKILIFFSDETKKTGVKPVKDLSEKMEEHNLANAILVAQNVLTAFARNAIASLAPQRNIEYFVENELLINITRHELVPKHVTLSEDEKHALLKQYKITDLQLPRIQQSDSVARYLGLQRGQVVKIIRPSESAGRYVTYRLGQVSAGADPGSSATHPTKDMLRIIPDGRVYGERFAEDNAEVPTIAIDLVTIEENSSVHQDEFLAHRLGMLPIDSRKVRQFMNKSECSCSDHCGKCGVQYFLNVVCREQAQQVVTHFDIIPSGQNPPMPVPLIGDVSKPSAEIPDTAMGITIAKLRTNQQIKAELLAVKGIGKLHAKWNPTATAVFRYEPDIRIDQELQKTVSAEIKRQIVEQCPRGVFQLKASARNETQQGSAADMNDFYMFGADDPALAAAADVEDIDLEVGQKMKCNFCFECREACEGFKIPNFITVRHLPDRFHFVVESTGTMPPEQIVEMALEILLDKLKVLSDKFMSVPATAAALGLSTQAMSHGGVLNLH